MRSRFHALAFACLLASCHCGTPNNTITTGPDPTVIEPKVLDGTEYVLDFGHVRAGATYEGHIIIENDGTAAWSVDSIAMRAGGPATLYMDAPKVPAKVDPSAQIDIKISWRPKVAETIKGYVDVDSDSEKKPHITVRIVGVAEAPMMEVCIKDAAAPNCDDQMAAGTDLAVDFGILMVTDPPAQRVLVVKNLAAVTDEDIRLHLSSVALQDGATSEFTVKTGSLVVAPSGQVEVGLSYQPANGGFDNAVLEIVGDDPLKPVVKVNLTGGGKAPEMKACAGDVTTPDNCPTTLDFGQVSQGDSKELVVTIFSTGLQSPLTLTAADLDPSTAPVFTLPDKPQLPMSLAPGAYYKLKVKFAPTAVGTLGGLVVLASDAGPGNIFLKGEGVAQPTCALKISPTTADFGQVSLNGFADKVLFGTNMGQKACNVTAFKDPTNAAFTLQAVPGVPYAVNPGATFTFSLRYKPTGTTAETGTMEVDSDDPVNPAITIDLKGQGKTPGPCEVQITPANLNFGNVPAGNTSALTLSIYNFGTDVCWVTDASLSASSLGFAITKAPMMIPTTIDSGGHLDFEVTFAPKTGGTFTGSMNIKAGAKIWSTTAYAVPLSGVAGAASICITPMVLDFGVQAVNNPVELAFTIQSCGAGLLELRGINLEAGSSNDYVITQKPPVPQNLGPSATTIVKVKFTASTTNPTFGRVKVLSNDSANPVAAVVLKANAGGCLEKILNCAPTALHFPKTATGLTSTQTFTCVSLGTSDVAVSKVQLGAASSAAFALSGKAVPPTLKPGQSFRMAVDYSPATVSSDVGSVQVENDGCLPHQVISLDGLSKAPDFPRCIPPKVFQPVTKWQWENPSVAPKSKTVWITPIVVPTQDTNGDGRIDEDDVSSVIFTTTEFKLNIDPTKTDMTPPGVLRAVDGKTGASLWDMTDPGLALNSEAQLAAGDIDGDNKVEIIGTLRYESPGTGTGNMQGKYKTGRLVAFENDGTFKWVSDFWNRSDDELEDGSAISIADLDQDGVPEIIVGASVFDADGRLLWEGKGGIGSTGHGAFSVVADINGDGKPEVIAGNTCYAADGHTLWTYGATDGMSIVVDVDGDTKPEVVLRTDAQTIVILDGNGKKKYGPFTLPDPTTFVPEGSDVSLCPAPITAADFSGSGKAQLAIPVGTYFAMLDPVSGQVLWTHPIDDWEGQCGASGAAAFDFEGDGKYEAVYQDTIHVFVFRGDGTVSFQDDRSSVTIWDTPAIVDVDGDGHADIVTVQDSGPGVKVINNATNDWVGTRRIWNEHAYHVTNVSDGGSIPRIEQPSWLVFNAYRANMPYCLK